MWERRLQPHGTLGPMSELAWGEGDRGVRFGLGAPPPEVEAGRTVRIPLVCENRSPGAVAVFGFRADYPRSLRVSPPKPHRPFIRVSFGDTNVLHPPEAFVTIEPGGRCETELDLSFAVERLGQGRYDVTFAYDPVRSAGSLAAYNPTGEVSTGWVGLAVVELRALRDAGIDRSLEEEIDTRLLAGDGDVVERLRPFGAAGAELLAHRLVRVMAPGLDSTVGWRAFDALTLLGRTGLAAIRSVRDELPHGDRAFDFAEQWLSHRLGRPPSPSDLQFTSLLDLLCQERSARQELALQWTACDSDVHGMRRVRVTGDGRVVRTVRPPGAIMSSSSEDFLTADQVELLVQALRDAAVWLLRPLRQRGLPDEPSPELEVQLAAGDAFARQIVMFNGEWQQGPAAALAGLMNRLAGERRFGSEPPAAR